MITYTTEFLPVRIRNWVESVQKKGGFPCLQTDTLALEPSTTLHDPFPCSPPRSVLRFMLLGIGGLPKVSKSIKNLIVVARKICR
jgi:hypothetical protein